MNLTKAKEILDLNIKEAGKGMPPDVKDALTLGFEALDYLERWRAKAEIQPYPLLKSETTG